ncbi:hypothetical protein R80B4_02481 [Fibrobacteres bacterium R8-0-B4]
MNKKTILTIAALCVAMTAAPAAPAQIRYVAVVETEVDAQSGAAAKLNKAEVREITAVLRDEARNNLPSDKYKIMTAETVIAQGTAVLEECAEENCVIALGSKIGADYIVRGTLSKFGTKLTLSIVMYETTDGTLVASARVVSSDKAEDLLEKTVTASKAMYKTFLNEQPAYQPPAPAPQPASRPPAPAPQPQYQPPAPPPPPPPPAGKITETVNGYAFEMVPLRGGRLRWGARASRGAIVMTVKSRRIL